MMDMDTMRALDARLWEIEDAYESGCRIKDFADILADVQEDTGYHYDMLADIVSETVEDNLQDMPAAEAWREAMRSVVMTAYEKDF